MGNGNKPSFEPPQRRFVEWSLVDEQCFLVVPVLAFSRRVPCVSAPPDGAVDTAEDTGPNDTPSDSGLLDLGSGSGPGPDQGVPQP